jgi:hypothetical protein
MDLVAIVIELRIRNYELGLRPAADGKAMILVLKKKKAATTEDPHNGKPARRPENQDVINKFLEEFGNLLNELNHPV